jgi:hypothetical protein
MSILVRGHDAGGLRWFLDERPVNAGVGLELRLPADVLGERWTPVRFETTARGGRGELTPVLVLHLGHAWEHRFTVVEAAAVPALLPDGRGRWAVYDRKRDCVVRCDERAAPEEDGTTPPVYPEIDVDIYRTRSEAEIAAARLQAEREGCPTLELVIEDVRKVELRWPRRG